MKLDIEQEFTNADDSPAIDVKTGKPITLKSILINSLLSEVTMGGQSLQLTPEDKIKRYSLFRDLKKTEVGFVTWNAEDIALAKKAIASAYTTLVVGQAYDMIEGSEK